MKFRGKKEKKTFANSEGMDFWFNVLHKLINFEKSLDFSATRIPLCTRLREGFDLKLMLSFKFEG